jgi:hypothetical protein
VLLKGVHDRITTEIGCPSVWMENWIVVSPRSIPIPIPIHPTLGDGEDRNG